MKSSVAAVVLALITAFVTVETVQAVQTLPDVAASAWSQVVSDLEMLARSPRGM